MARWNLLRLTQKVLNASDDDSVNSIESNTTEACDSALEIIEEVYFDLIHSEDWPWLMEVGHLDSLSDATQPTILRIPDNVTLLEHQEIFQYDVTTAADTNSKYRDLIYKEPGDFLRMLRNRNDSDANVTKFTGYKTTDLLIKTDKMPEYWTTFDDEYVVMDSIDQATDSTLLGSKTTVQLKKIPTWTVSDAFIPDLPDNMFPNFLAKCKAKYFAYYVQKDNTIDQVEAQGGKARQRRKGTKHEGRNKRKDYGRKSGRTGGVIITSN